MFITGNDGARTMQVEVEAPEARAPRPFQVSLTGSATGPNGGWGYLGTVRAIADPSEIPTAEDTLLERLVAGLPPTLT